jgi:xylulokinase
MVPSLTAVDGEGRPLSPGLLYGDERGASDQGAGLTAETSGFLRWTADEVPSAKGFWAAPAVANYALASQAVIDLGTASMSTPLFNGAGWDPVQCADCGASVEQLPRVAMMGEAVGELPGGPVLAAGSVDALCEQLVTGIDQEGDVLVLCGTTLIVWAITSSAAEVPGLWTIPHLVPGRHQIGGPSNAGGLFLSWVDQLVGTAGAADPPDPRLIPVWSPYVRGERAPFHDPSRRALLDGLDLTHGPAAVRRGAFEASGFVVRHMLELAGVRPRRIVATGGGTRVGPWMQALADATRSPVEVFGVPEGAALGAAFFARMAVGLESDMTDAARWSRIDRVVEPDPLWVGPMEDRYARFRQLADDPR